MFSYFSKYKYRAIAAITLLLAIICTIFLTKRVGVNNEKVIEHQHFVVTDSSLQDREVYISTSGRIRAKNKFLFTSQVNGKVIKIAATRGASFKKGGVILKIDERDKADILENAKIKLKQAKLLMNSSSMLYEKGYGSESDLLKAKAAVSNSEAEFKRATLDLENCELRAPYNGYVENIYASLGQDVNQGQQLCDFVSNYDVVVDVTIPIHKVGLLKEGADAIITLENGEKLIGIISSKGKVIDDKTSSVLIEVSLVGGNIFSGQAAYVSLAAGTIPLHKLPQSSLTLDENGTMGIKVLTDGIVCFKNIRIMDENYDAIFVDGLDKYEKVITVGHQYAQIGTKVASSS